MTEMVAYTPPSQTALTIGDEQHQFTDMQVSALKHMGVEGASEGDLAVFFHVVKRTGLDPFARQIYMISRRTRNQQTNEYEHKQTIQTGIDGYRLIGRRAAARTGESISVEAPEWCRDNGSWVPVWSAAWGTPLAARVTIRRDGQPFTAVANFDEYKQTTRNGDLNSMWRQRPGGQIAKCAEAAAWRMAFPQDLADIYTDDEMGQADNATPAPRRATAAALLTPPVNDEPASPVDSEAAERNRGTVTDAQLKKLHTVFTEAGIKDRDDRLRVASALVHVDLSSSTDLSKEQASDLLNTLDQLEQEGVLAETARSLLSSEDGA